MTEEIIGHSNSISILEKLFQGDFPGRTIIFQGNAGIGKFSTALSLSEKLLGQNPFLSMGFQFFRNDQFFLKTQYFLKHLEISHFDRRIQRYFHYLKSRIAAEIALGTPSGKSGQYQEMRQELEDDLITGQLITRLSGDQSYRERVADISAELTKKQKIPIDFIRSAIEFHSQKAIGDYKITVIGEFENATQEAQNAALKLFEEPPHSSTIILTVNHLNHVLPTIQSRSVLLKFHPLGPDSLAAIFGENPHRLKNTVDFMEDNVYQIHTTRRNWVKRFFSSVAPQVQFGKGIFDFIDEITESDKMFSIYFLEELLYFIRMVQIERQASIRSKEMKKFNDEDYRNFTSRVAAKTDTSELADLSDSVAQLIRKIKFGNVTPKTVLPSILIKISRWYQLRSK